MRSVDVIVPTYRRPDHLARCLASLARQTLPPAAVVVVVRAGDEESVEVARCGAPAGLVRCVRVRQPGVVAAMRAGVAASSGEILAFCDDDAEPHAEWLAGLVALVSRPGVGAAGGRDLIPGETTPPAPVVGVFTRWGRLIGNHHLGAGSLRSVDILKGVNMAFRREALSLPGPGVLRGAGAEAHFEVLVCLSVAAQGWRLLYDPSVRVDHAGAARHGPDRRVSPGWPAILDAAHNSVLAVGAVPHRHRARRLVHALIAGSRAEPSFGRLVLALVRSEREVLRRGVPSLMGKLLGIAAVLGRRSSLVSADALSAPRPEEGTADVGPGGTGSGGRPRVALVAHDIHDAGGMERSLAELIRRGSDRVEFVVVSSTLPEELRRLVDWRRVRVPRRPFPLKYLGFFIVASRQVARLRVDLVHTTGAIVAPRVDVATVHFCHAGYREANGSVVPRTGSPARRVNAAASRLLALAAERWCFRTGRVARLAAVSEGVASELARFYPAVPRAVTPNGVDASRFRADGEARVRGRSEAGLGADAVVALFVGGEWERKGLDVAIEGLAAARASGATSLELWVVGAGDRRRFRRAAERVGVGDQVRFLGFRTDVEELYRLADIVVLPSRYETFSLVAYEAAACGLPIVATDCSGIRELVGEDVGGFLADPTPDSIGAALLSLARDPALRAAKGRAACERAASFTWERSVRGVVEVYGELLSPRSVVPTRA